VCVGIYLKLKSAFDGKRDMSGLPVGAAGPSVYEYGARIVDEICHAVLGPLTSNLDMLDSGVFLIEGVWWGRELVQHV